MCKHTKLKHATFLKLLVLQRLKQQKWTAASLKVTGNSAIW